MSIRYENHCNDCAGAGHPCQGNLCSLRRVPVHYCDTPKCNNELGDEIYEVDGDELCLDCLKKRFRKEC